MAKTIGLLQTKIFVKASGFWKTEVRFLRSKGRRKGQTSISDGGKEKNVVLKYLGPLIKTPALSINVCCHINTSNYY